MYQFDSVIESGKKSHHHTRPTVRTYVRTYVSKTTTTTTTTAGVAQMNDHPNVLLLRYSCMHACRYQLLFDNLTLEARQAILGLNFGKQASLGKKMRRYIKHYLVRRLVGVAVPIEPVLDCCTPRLYILFVVAAAVGYKCCWNDAVFPRVHVFGVCRYALYVLSHAHVCVRA